MLNMSRLFQVVSWFLELTQVYAQSCRAANVPVDSLRNLKQWEKCNCLCSLCEQSLCFCTYLDMIYGHCHADIIQHRIQTVSCQHSICFVNDAHVNSCNISAVTLIMCNNLISLF